MLLCTGLLGIDEKNELSAYIQSFPLFYYYYIIIIIIFFIIISLFHYQAHAPCKAVILWNQSNGRNPLFSKQFYSRCHKESKMIYIRQEVYIKLDKTYISNKPTEFSVLRTKDLRQNNLWIMITTALFSANSR